MEMDCAGVMNPYGSGESADRIISVLESIGDFSTLVRKRFTDRKLNS
jgi:hypothetical protein